MACLICSRLLQFGGCFCASQIVLPTFVPSEEKAAEISSAVAKTAQPPAQAEVAESTSAPETDSTYDIQALKVCIDNCALL